MIHSYVDNLFCDGYYFFMRGWILHKEIPSWSLSKKIVLYSNVNTIQIVPDLDLRPDVSQAFNTQGGKDFINYDHSGFVLKVLKQNLPSDYFNVRIEVKCKEISETVNLKNMIYI